MKSTFLQYFNKIAIITLITMVSFGCTKKSSTTSNSQSIQWVSSLNLGLQQGEEQKKPLFIDFGAEWCGACKEMDETTYKEAQVVETLNKNFIPVKLDNTDITEEKKMILQKYGVIGLPTIVILDAEGKTLKESSFVGYATKKELMENITKALDQVDATSGQCKSC